MTQSSSSSLTNSRLCKYCNKVQIYWNNSKGTFVEVETGNKHFCKSARTKPPSGGFPSEGNTRPTYYNAGTGKPFQTQQQKQPTKNSIQVLKGSEIEVQKQYERLSDIVVGELGGKIHGSQSHYLNEELRIVVYYEVPASDAENREMVKKRLN
ncbi:MAG: hypothetical protein MRJ93_12935 [Nitrososphaeraceae archaeon]|nr:hypothetical protein [Nitrososphaeraceae archaeon]